MTKMAWFKVHPKFSALTILFALFQLVKAEEHHHNKYCPEAKTCRLLNDKFILSSPWGSSPLVFEPIVRGRLTVWAGHSTITDSGFNCLPRKDDKSSGNSSEIALEFANYSNELEWTFYDINKGTTYMGISVEHRDNMTYNVTIANKQMDSYLECNTVEKIEGFVDGTQLSIRSTCDECNEPIVVLVESLIRELLRTKLEEQIVDNLYWQLTQLLTNQHFSIPLPLANNLD